MHIKHDWTINFDEEQFITFHGDSFARLLQNSTRRETLRQAVAEMTQAVKPAACWDTFPIQKIMHEKLVLANGVRIGGGPVVQVIGGAEELMVAICTVGPTADEVIAAAQKQKDLFRTMLLNDLAAWGVDMVRQQLCLQFETETRQQGLRVSAPLSPGESVWPIKEQAILFSLLDAGQIGVSLSPSMVMTPLKSLSMIMGFGAQPMGVEGASNCDFCSIKERCSYRRLRPTAQPAPAL
ncbi:MAG: hypothetical protein BroJett011_71900 [Chloroflexota bacterium]|nr:MAG: hypothetical protein BroJett011_71900 [Chloroflexota bacterium]